MLHRRQLLSLVSSGALMSAIAGPALGQTRAQEPVRRLLLVHGRDQQGNDPKVLQDQWVTALKRGAAALGRKLPEGLDVDFPFYGDLLAKYASANKVPLVARGEPQTDQQFLEFEGAVAEELRKRAGITDQEINAEYSGVPQQRGPQNWEWVQAIIRTLDKYGGRTSSNTIELIMRDVYLYVYQGGVRDEVDRVVVAHLTEEPTVVVAHSLGSVVAYNLLRTDPRALHIPLLVTLGCPLAIRAIRSQLAPLRCPKPVRTWNNAFDPRDVVALYPLDQENFPLSPPITNYGKVNNHTDNRHGIDGYLDDTKVAGWILDALG